MFTIVPKKDDAAATIFYRITLHIPHGEAVPGTEGEILEDRIHPPSCVRPEADGSCGGFQRRAVEGGVSSGCPRPGADGTGWP